MTCIQRGWWWVTQKLARLVPCRAAHSHCESRLQWQWMVIDRLTSLTRPITTSRLLVHSQSLHTSAHKLCVNTTSSVPSRSLLMFRVSAQNVYIRDGPATPGGADGETRRVGGCGPENPSVRRRAGGVGTARAMHTNPPHPCMEGRRARPGWRERGTEEEIGGRWRYLRG